VSSDEGKVADLFGGPDTAPPPKRSPNARVVGYGAPPGTGPAGQTCGTCGNCWRKNTGGRRTYLKCLVGHVSSSKASDIKARSPACHKWKADE